MMCSKTCRDENHAAGPLCDVLDRIGDYTHHGEDVGDLTPDHIDAAYLTGFVRWTLDAANTLRAWYLICINICTARKARGVYSWQPTAPGAEMVSAPFLFVLG